MIAQNVIAAPPFGHALAIQNSDIAPTARRTRRALMVGGQPVGDVQSRHSLDGDHVARVDHARRARSAPAPCRACLGLRYPPAVAPWASGR